MLCTADLYVYAVTTTFHYLDDLKHCKLTHKFCSGQTTEMSQDGPAETHCVSYNNGIVQPKCGLPHCAHTCVDSVCVVFVTALAVFFTISDVCNRLTGSSGLSFKICKQLHVKEKDASGSGAATSTILKSSAGFTGVCSIVTFMTTSVMWS